MNEQDNTLSKIKHLLEESYKLRVNNLEESVMLANEALILSEKIQDKAGIGKSLNMLSLFSMICGKGSEALSFAERAITCFELLEDEIGVADAKYSIAGIHYKTNNYHLGMIYLIDALVIYQKYNDWHNVSRTQKSLGAIYEILGDKNNAAEAYRIAIESAKKCKNKNFESNAYNPMSGILLKQDKPKEALDMINKSITLKSETGDDRGLAFAIYGRGKVYSYNKKYEKACADFIKALDIHEKYNEVYGIGMAKHKLAQLYLETGEIERAKTLLKEVVAHSTKFNLSRTKYKASHLLYETYRSENEHKEALKYLESYLMEKDASVNSQTLKVIENYERISKIKYEQQEENLRHEKEAILVKEKQADETAKMRQSFLSAMSHEIRTPLNAVTSIISLLKERADADDQKLLTSLQFSSKNLMRIINDILDFSKLDSDKMELEMHPVNFAELINNIRETYLGMALEKGIQLNVNIDIGLSKFYKLDETKLFQILGNLVSNAIKYTNKGSVDIDIELISSAGNKDTVYFGVKDTGVGIAKDEQNRLFDSFYIPSTITTRNNGGTGLGLAIVKKIVQLYGSTVNLTSKKGKGSTFYFELVLQKSKDIVKIDQKQTNQLKNKTAILAEDNEVNALVMGQLLKKWGVKIERVKNGMDAVEAAKKVKVDFILMDIHMPEMNGFDAAKLIRNSKNENQHTPIYALTADVTAVNNEDYLTFFNGFLWKPLQIDRLFDTLVNQKKNVK
ncbi:tetratricopeptide repeat-containing hybrid sensor histidine kinase/response regulator [Aquimarina sp. 2201CG14-23]|uniref:tetratricopeptide repeat-containing hybrid sensor histidine kinase/response regulator n=1 Tax=Aquimarina mycalae TaxID=3040073 RepID=UPI002477D34C|nr:ATP-binding protein [Aquimarina sp. 2201CG14-23]MDH7445708.1 ATP-binding protein [Aquimarina sp. 2201CG14-23]